MNKNWFIDLALLTLLAMGLFACTPEKRDPGNTQIKVMIDESGCHPTDWRVPTGTLIQLDIDNQTNQEYIWVFMERPATPPFDDSDAVNAYFAQQVKPNTNVSVTFTSPLAPMEYQVICSALPYPDEYNTGRIVVVQP
jgi:hypothetical protein